MQTVQSMQLSRKGVGFFCQIAQCLSGAGRRGTNSLALAALAVVASEEVVQAVTVALVRLWGVPLVAEVVGIRVDAQKANETVQLPDTVLQQHEGCERFGGRSGMLHL